MFFKEELKSFIKELISRILLYRQLKTRGSIVVGQEAFVDALKARDSLIFELKSKYAFIKSHSTKELRKITYL